MRKKFLVTNGYQRLPTVTKTGGWVTAGNGRREDDGWRLMDDVGEPEMLRARTHV
jgi:hypothetical protein